MNIAWWKLHICIITSSHMGHFDQARPNVSFCNSHDQS
jgi:hypothetical protein